MNSSTTDAYRDHLNPQYLAFLERLGLDRRIERAEGCRLVDSDGREYVDFVAGYGVFNLGHNPPSVISAIVDELHSKPLWNRPFLNDALARLAPRLTKLTSGRLSRLFLCNSGAEAIDSALKLARLVSRRPGIVAAQGGFHGFTLGALSASGIPSQSRPFKPLLPDVRHVAFGDSEALDAAVDESVAAVLLEPVQAEIGGVVSPAGYLQEAGEICTRRGALLVLDEVRTGMGRTGGMLASGAENVVPDIVVLGKALGAGIVPVGAVLARPEYWTRFGMSFAMSASSFAGNRLAAVAGLATLDCFDDGRVLANGTVAGQALHRELASLQSEFEDLVVDLTGRGLLLGLHFPDRRLAFEFVRLTIENGVLTAQAFCNTNCVLLEPPLVIEPRDVQRSLGVFRRVLQVLRRESK